MKLDLICSKDELRPTMCHVKITKEVMVATDAHVIGVIPTKLMFSDGFIDKIPEEGILIHAEDFKKFALSSNIVWKSDDVIRVIYPKKRDVLIQVEKEYNVGKYPNWEAVIPQKESRVYELNKVGINMEIGARLQKALGLESLALEFSGQTKGVYVRATSKKLERGIYGVIMPIMLVD